MKAHFMLNQFDSVEHFASIIIDRGAPSIDGSNLALLYLGKSAYSRGDFEKATDYFIEALNSAKDINGAEAQYL